MRASSEHSEAIEIYTIDYLHSQLKEGVASSRIVELLEILSSQPEELESEEDSLKRKYSILNFLKKAHASGLSIKQINDFILKSDLAVYIARNDYYYPEKTKTWHPSQSYRTPYTWKNIQEKFEQYYEFLVYLHQKGLSLEDIQTINSKKYNKLSFISFLEDNLASITLKYLAAGFLDQDTYEYRRFPSRSLVADALIKQAPEVAFIYLLQANDPKTPLGRYFSGSDDYYKGRFNAVLAECYAEHTINYIRSNSLPEEHLLRLAQPHYLWPESRWSLIWNLVNYSNIEVLREAFFDSDSTLGKFFTHNNNLSDSYQITLQKALSRRLIDHLQSQLKEGADIHLIANLLNDLSISHAFCEEHYKIPILNQKYSLLNSLKSALERGLSIEEIFDFMLRNKLGIYIISSYYHYSYDYSDDDYDDYRRYRTFSCYTQTEIQEQSEQYYEFLVYMHTKGLSLEKIQTINSHKHEILIRIHNNYELDGDFIRRESFTRFLTKAPAKTILKYIAAGFLNQSSLSKLNVIDKLCVKRIADAIDAQEPADSFTYLLQANDNRTPLGNYFLQKHNQIYLNKFNQELVERYAEHTINYIRLNSLPNEHLLRLAEHKMALVKHLEDSLAGTELLREALDPESALGKFFKLSTGFFDSTTKTCLAQLKNLLDRRTRTAESAADNPHRLFVSLKVLPSDIEEIKTRPSVISSLNHS